MVVLVPYAVLALLATGGRGVAEPALRDERLGADGEAGISSSVMAGVAPLLEAAWLVARVVRLVDMMRSTGSCARRGTAISEYWELFETLSSSKSGSMSVCILLALSNAEMRR